MKMTSNHQKELYIQFRTSFHILQGATGTLNIYKNKQIKRLEKVCL